MKIVELSKLGFNLADANFTAEVYDQVKQYCLRDAISENIESCGVILQEGDKTEVIPVANVHEDPANFFLISPDYWVQMAGYLHSEKYRVTLYHSHLSQLQPYFSPYDADYIYNSGLPALLYVVPIDKFCYWDPNKIRPYEGRVFNSVFDNCYSLVREWQWRERGIHMDWFQLHSMKEFEALDWNRFEENLGGQGFKKIIDGTPCSDCSDHALERGDLVLMRYVLNTPHGDHIAVVTDPAKNEILHHMLDHISGYASYGRKYRELTVSVWRYEPLITH